jgi:hypothetical protein
MRQDATLMFVFSPFFFTVYLAGLRLELLLVLLAPPSPQLEQRLVPHPVHHGQETIAPGWPATQQGTQVSWSMHHQVTGCASLGFMAVGGPAAGAWALAASNPRLLLWLSWTLAPGYRTLGRQSGSNTTGRTVSGWQRRKASFERKVALRYG